MTSQNLDNLGSIGELRIQAFGQEEFDGLIKSARTCLKDAKNQSISLDSRFAIAYKASHALALAALRWHGYRSNNRYLVFQCLPKTLGLEPEQCQLLALCHRRRNLAEYEGTLDVEERLVADLIDLSELMLKKVRELGPPRGSA